MDRLGKDDGFTMVEVLVAIMIVSIGAMATFTLLTSATRNAQRAKASQVALEYAEQEMEQLRSMAWEQLALKGAPSHEGSAVNPNYRVLNEKFALNREPLGNYQTLVHNGEGIWGEPEKVIEGGTVSPGPTPFTSGDVSGKVYRYIVWRNDEACGSACPGPQDYKQIVIAVKVDTRGNEAGQRGYFEVQSNFVDPEDSAKNDPAPGPGGKVVTAQQFFLTDTSCSAAGTTASPTIHQEITGSHLLHNSRGTCEAGQKTGSTPGAPDALMLGLPPDPDPEDPAIPGEYDYANDSYLDTSPDTGTGVQIKKDDTSGCHYQPDGDDLSRVTDPPVGDRQDDRNLRDEGKGDARVLYEVPQQPLGRSAHLRLPLQAPRTKRKTRRSRTSKPGPPTGPGGQKKTRIGRRYGRRCD